jgi:hypothetical protein
MFMNRLLSGFALIAATAIAADISGYVVDRSCVGKRAMWTNTKCIETCARKGDPLVLATGDGRVFQIVDQSKVRAHGGRRVTVTGRIDGDKITGITAVK